MITRYLIYSIRSFYLIIFVFLTLQTLHTIFRTNLKNESNFICTLTTNINFQIKFLPLFNLRDFLIMLFILELNGLGFLSGSPKITFVLGCATVPVEVAKNGDSLLNPNFRSLFDRFWGYPILRKWVRDPILIIVYDMFVKM